MRHGAKVEYKKCSSEGCTNLAQQGGVCIRHGAKVKRCSSEGCTNKAQKGGVCKRHGERPTPNEDSSTAFESFVLKKYKKKRCCADGCTKFAQNGGVCVRHGAKREYKRCSSEGCLNLAKRGGVCRRHGAELKLCSSERCTNHAKRGGVCWRHGGKRTSNDESTAFESKFDETTTTQNLPHRSADGALNERRTGVPGEVVICQEIVEV